MGAEILRGFVNAVIYLMILIILNILEYHHKKWSNGTVELIGTLFPIIPYTRIYPQGGPRMYKLIQILQTKRQS